MTSYEELEKMEYKKAIAGKEFSIDNPIADLINQVQRVYSKVTDYIDKVIDNQKSTIDKIVKKYNVNKNKDKLNYQFSY